MIAGHCVGRRSGLCFTNGRIDFMKYVFKQTRGSEGRAREMAGESLPGNRKLLQGNKGDSGLNRWEEVREGKQPW
jgi:hypothetical protein